MRISSRQLQRRSKYFRRKVDHEAKMVWIVDDNGPLSVTNDAENVCKEVNALHPGYRIIYCDSDRNWDELLHNNGIFTGFAPARNLTP